MLNLQGKIPAKTEVTQKWYRSIGLSLTLNRWHSFLTLKGTRSFNRKKLVLKSQDKEMWLITVHRAPARCCWKPVIWFLVPTGLPLLTDRENWQTGSGRLIPAIDKIAASLITSTRWLAFRYQLFAPGTLWIFINRICCLLPLKPVFYNLKHVVLWNFQRTTSD